MADLHVLVVCEGPSDFALIEGVISETGKSLGKRFESTQLEPQLDATGSRHNRFGWTGVQSWCKKCALNRATKGVDAIGNFLFWSEADILLIHMDTDVASIVSINEMTFPQNHNLPDRRNWVSSAIDSWLGIAKIDKCKYVLPTWQIETWLLATYDHSTSPDIFAEPLSDYENIINVEERLIKLGYKTDKERPDKLYKELKLFKTNPRYRARLLKNLATASSRCLELRELQHLLLTSPA